MRKAMAASPAAAPRPAAIHQTRLGLPFITLRAFTQLTTQPHARCGNRYNFSDGGDERKKDDAARIRDARGVCGRVPAAYDHGSDSKGAPEGATCATARK